jgi:hypothetical protein
MERSRRTVRCAWDDQGMSATADVRQILTLLVDHDSRGILVLRFEDRVEWADALGREVDDALLEARASGLLEGERREGDGSLAYWSFVHPTVAGFRELGQWPPRGREWEAGPWDDGYWGARARPLLRRLHEQPPLDGFYLKPVEEDEEKWRDWTTLFLLAEADLVSGTLQDGGIDALRVLPAGREALDPTPRDIIDEAEAKLRTGARVDAIVTAVERGLGSRLRVFAERHDLPEAQAPGLARLNNALCKAGIYDESDRAQIEAWVKLRNRFAHAQDEAISDARAAAAIAAIRVFLDEHPT